MTNSTQLTDSRRRDFLRGSLAAAAGVAVTTIATQSLAGVAETDADVQSDHQEGYRMTRHIADYYKSAAI